MTFDHWHVRGWLEFGRKLFDCPVRVQITAGEKCVIVQWFALDGPLAGIPLKRVQF